MKLSRDLFLRIAFMLVKEPVPLASSNPNLDMHATAKKGEGLNGPAGLVT